MQTRHEDKFEVSEQSVRRESEIDRILKLNDRLKAENAELVEALKAGITDGRLQTFADRERWRNRARAVLAKAEKGEG